MSVPKEFVVHVVGYKCYIYECTPIICCNNNNIYPMYIKIRVQWTYNDIHNNHSRYKL